MGEPLTVGGSVTDPHLYRLQETFGGPRRGAVRLPGRWVPRHWARGAPRCSNANLMRDDSRGAGCMLVPVHGISRSSSCRSRDSGGLERQPALQTLRGPPLVRRM